MCVCIFCQSHFKSTTYGISQRLNVKMFQVPLLLILLALHGSPTPPTLEGQWLPPMCVVPGGSNASIALRTPQDWSHRHGLQPVASRCRTRHRPEAEEIWHQTCSERWNIHKHHAESCISALNIVNPAHGNLMKLMVLEWKHAPEGKKSVIFSQWKWKLYGSCHAAACCGMPWHAAGHLLQLLKVFWGPVCRLVHLQFKQVGIGNQPVISNLEPYII